MNGIAKLQKIAEAASANGDAFKSMYDVTLKASQQMFSLNNDFFHAFVEGNALPKNSLDSRELINAYAQNLERVSAYFRDISDLCSKTQVEVFEAGSLRADEVTKFFFAEIETLLKPFSVDQAGFSDALKSVLSTANSTYEKIFDTSRQLAEASLSAATQVGKAASESAEVTVAAARKRA